VGGGAPSRPHGHLRKVSAGAPMDLVAIDIMSGLPATADGYKYLLVATDYFIKWLEAIPLCDAEAHTCMRALYSAFFSRFGLPRQLHSDQDSNFESKLVAELCSIAGINKTRTTPFHPRSDGQTERAVRCTARVMARSPARTVGGIPHDAALSDGYQSQHGHDGARSPATGFSHCVAAGGARRSHNLFCAEFRQNMRNAHASVRSATSRAAKTQKNYFDKHVKGPPFVLIQLVWLYWPRTLLHNRSRKLTRSCLGVLSNSKPRSSSSCKI